MKLNSRIFKKFVRTIMEIGKNEILQKLDIWHIKLLIMTRQIQ